ncbi:unnamed protein product [Thelazia callipaeda]|uniref:Transposase n=1 Tax=Thelazia callipaeda TaxID=103827 RepID=A0A0N5CY67_THECL|nr:unnamed protein product [Thelazia callipaeda]
MTQQRYTYTIEPLEGREFIQRNFATLPQRAYKYSNRAVTLNERFSIIERGYLLVPDISSVNRKYQERVCLVPRKNNH